MLITRLVLALVLVSTAPLAMAGEPPAPPTMTVYKSPSCGCCIKWVEYLRDNGFTVRVIDRLDVGPVKRQLGVHPRLASCHTAVVGGYVIEGHVPVDDIRKLLAERPELAGLTAPGMPQMSPGMLSLEPRGYDVLGFDRDGNVSLYSRY